MSLDHWSDCGCDDCEARRAAVPSPAIPSMEEWTRRRDAFTGWAKHEFPDLMTPPVLWNHDPAATYTPPGSQVDPDMALPSKTLGEHNAPKKPSMWNRAWAWLAAPLNSDEDEQW